MQQTSLLQIFAKISDPRVNRRKKHCLPDIIVLSIPGVLCGADTCDGTEMFGKANPAFLKQFLSLKNGIPLHDTINCVFQAINPRRFERCFAKRSNGLKDNSVIERVVAIDGKTYRGSKDSFHRKSPIHTVHARSVENGICPGQIQCGEKSNEITAIPQMLDMLNITECIITIDAMGMQTEIAEKIRENSGDYILAVKGNQGGLEEEVEATCNRHRPVSDTTTLDKGHGRIEARRCEVFEKGLMADKENRWAGLETVIRITSTRETGDKTETNTGLYISSIDSKKMILTGSIATIGRCRK